MLVITAFPIVYLLVGGMTLWIRNAIMHPYCHNGYVVPLWIQIDTVDPKILVFEV